MAAHVIKCICLGLCEANDSIASPVTIIMERSFICNGEGGLGQHREGRGQHSASPWEVSDLRPPSACTEAGRGRERKGNYLCMSDDCWKPSPRAVRAGLQASTSAQRAVAPTARGREPHLAVRCSCLHGASHRPAVFLTRLTGQPSTRGGVYHAHAPRRPLAELALHCLSEGT